ncbi:DUF2271 domain-containing protein [Xylophilus sp. GOD-11R]|uniref:DUF2271 domain-containing protein n=1 Tax=Xylophilus sp. GOD-11R TaxID=3089814 RepID=UPI00298C0934|nr:DUF2271 domain-containing protein [Xylophilus sp. GOD-11R]WPB56100.1 DUF2271 domain-containing protein [Xylophilus sp. GOD-11R]
MQLRYSTALASLIGAPAFAAGLSVNVEVPRINTAEYHRPYVAVWVEKADQSVASHLAVWYDIRTRDNAAGEGTKWLKDLRQWWRRGGRELQMPVDGVSGATKPVGTQTLAFTEGRGPFAKLPAGDYKLMVEAAREGGGREVVSVPFTWPSAKAQQLQARGSEELGLVAVELKP